MNPATPLPARLLERFLPGRRVPAMLAVGALQVALAGCASWEAPARMDDAAWRTRAISATKQGVGLRAAVLSAEDSRRVFGVDVNATGVQSVWVEVRNRTPHMLWLLHAGTDPDYFSPLEVAWSFHRVLAGATNAAIDEHFDSLGFRNPIPPETTKTGILFTNPHHRTRLLNVDLLGQRMLIPFTLFLPVPGEAPDESADAIKARCAEAQNSEFRDPDAFRAALEQLPGCATEPDGVARSDPVNLVLVGDIADIGAALVRRGFRRDEETFDARQRLFGRTPDIVVRKGSQSGAPANWIRMWVAPFTYQGQSVFACQTGRPVGGRFARAEGKELVLHPDVDEARDLLIQDLLYSDGLAQLGFVAGGGSATVAGPRDSLAEAGYYTDGLRAVIFFTVRPSNLSDFQLLDWVPYVRRREAEAASKNSDLHP